MKPDANRVDRAAADWLARHEQGLSANEEREFARWLEADPRHGERYRVLQQSWSRLDRLRGSKLAGRLEAELHELPARGATDDPVSRISSARIRLHAWVSGAVAAGLVWGIAYAGWWRPLQTRVPYADAAATAIGVARKMDLPDGSVVHLNTNTAIEVLFTKAERRVRLGRGEAFFTIAKNKARPFVVTVAGVDVRAVGTEFNVRLRAEAVEVIVREGKVRVDEAASGESLLARAVSAGGRPDAEPPILTAGERVVISVAAAPQPALDRVMPLPVAPHEIERSLAWQDRKLVFESAPLAAIVEEFNRYNRQQLRVDDPHLAARRFGGTFMANDPNTLIELLRTSYEVTVEERGSETMLRQGR